MVVFVVVVFCVCCHRALFLLFLYCNPDGLLHFVIVFSQWLNNANYIYISKECHTYRACMFEYANKWFLF